MSVTMEMLAVPDVMSRLGVGDYAVRRLLQRGDLAHLRIGKHIRVPSSEVERFIRRRTVRGRRNR